MNIHAQLHTRQTGLHSSISTTMWSQRGHPEYTWEKKPFGWSGHSLGPAGSLQRSPDP